MPYTDDELVARLRKVLHAAKHAADETGCEAALHAVERLLASHHVQILRLFPPPSNLPRIQELGERIVALTEENGARVIELRLVKEQLRRAENEIAMLKSEIAALQLQSQPQPEERERWRRATSPPKHPRAFGNAHRAALMIIHAHGRICLSDIYEIMIRAGYKPGTVSGRLSELRTERYFGVSYVERFKVGKDFEFELTEAGRRAVEEGLTHAPGTENRELDGQHDDADGQHDDADDDVPISGDGYPDAEPERGAARTGD